MARQTLAHNHLAEGEATGHFHAAEGVSTLCDLGDGVLEFDARASDVVITHQEHHAIPMPRRVMRSGICREYDHFQEEARTVVD